MLLFTITGMMVWIGIAIIGLIAFAVLLAVLWDNIPNSIKWFFPDLCFVFSCLWGDREKKSSKLLLLTTTRGNNWAIKASRWILNIRKG